MEPDLGFDLGYEPYMGETAESSAVLPAPWFGTTTYVTSLNGVSAPPAATNGNQSPFPVPSMATRVHFSDPKGSHRTAEVRRPDEEPRDRIKRTRTACEECRKRKQKCDGFLPCHPCSEQSNPCRYRDVPPTKKDDTLNRMLQIVEKYDTTLASLNTDLDNMNNTLKNIEQRLNYSWQTRASSAAREDHYTRGQGRDSVAEQQDASRAWRQSVHQFGENSSRETYMVRPPQHQQRSNPGTW